MLLPWVVPKIHSTSNQPVLALIEPQEKTKTIPNHSCSYRILRMVKKVFACYEALSWPQGWTEMGPRERSSQGRHLLIGIPSAEPKARNMKHDLSELQSCPIFFRGNLSNKTQDHDSGPRDHKLLFIRTRHPHVMWKRGPPCIFAVVPSSNQDCQNLFQILFVGQFCYNQLQPESCYPTIAAILSFNTRFYQPMVA